MMTDTTDGMAAGLSAVREAMNAYAVEETRWQGDVTRRALWVERDAAIARAERAEAERDEARKAIEAALSDTATELGCAPDNEAILAAIAALKAERDRLLEAMEKIAAPVTKLMCAVDAARAARDIARTTLKEPAHD